MASEKKQTKREWTPGPWRVVDSDLPPYKSIVAGSNTARKLGKGWIGAAPVSERGSAREQAANAHLIASAPDLYDALEEVLGHAFCADWCMSGAGKDCTCGSEVVAAKARAALRKAEGLS